MNNNFFTLNGKKYVILFDNVRVTILRKENDKLVLLNQNNKTCENKNNDFFNKKQIVLLSGIYINY